MAQLALHGIDKFFDTTRTLADVYLTVEDGEFVSLVGPSGCGKTTLLRIIAGLDKPSKGEINIDGQSVNKLDPAQRNIAMVFQSYALYPHKTVFENIAFPLRMQAPFLTRMPLAKRVVSAYRSLEKDIRKRVYQTAAMVGLEHLLERKPGHLSGGQRQRVALARAMVRDPKIFLMDEPLSNLDAKLRSAMRAEIIELQRRISATFVYVTHDQGEAMTMSDRIVLLNEGCVQQIGAPNELYDNPANLFVAEFIGSPKINISHARLSQSGELQVFGHRLYDTPSVIDRIRVPIDQPFLVGLRPEALTIAEPSSPSALSGSVRLLENLGNEFLLTLQPSQMSPALSAMPSTQQILARLPNSIGRRLRIGERVALQPDWKQALLFTPDGYRIAQQSQYKQAIA